VLVDVGVTVGVNVAVGVTVGVLVKVAVGVMVGVAVGVGVGASSICALYEWMFPHPEVHVMFSFVGPSRVTTSDRIKLQPDAGK
jgi:hypothetical protein